MDTTGPAVVSRSWSESVCASRPAPKLLSGPAAGAWLRSRATTPGCSSAGMIGFACAEDPVSGRPKCELFTSANQPVRSVRPGLGNDAPPFLCSRARGGGAVPTYWCAGDVALRVVPDAPGALPKPVLLFAGAMGSPGLAEPRRSTSAQHPLRPPLRPGVRVVAHHKSGGLGVGPVWVSVPSRHGSCLGVGPARRSAIGRQDATRHASSWCFNGWPRRHSGSVVATPRLAMIHPSPAYCSVCPPEASFSGF